MKRLIWTALAFLLLAGGALSLAGEPKDILDRPIPWGKTSGGKRLSLYVARTRLLYGEPVTFVLQPSGPHDKPPYVQLRWRGSKPSVELHLYDSAGNQLPFGLRLNEGTDGTFGRLLPRGKSALGRHFKPDKYEMYAVLSDSRDPRHPRKWVGAVDSNKVEFEVLAPRPRSRAELAPKELRKRAERWFAELGKEHSVESGQHFLRVRGGREAESQLGHLLRETEGFGLVPRLEQACASKNPGTAARAARLIRRRLLALSTAKTHEFYLRMPEDAPLLAMLGPTSWRFIRELATDYEYRLLRVKAARYGPLPAYRGLSRPAAGQVKKIVAGLKHKNFEVRIGTIRSLSKTADPRILKALAGCLRDEFAYTVATAGTPVPDYPVADEAGEALVWQGRPAIDPVIELCRTDVKRKDDWPAVYRGVRLLGRMGPDPRSLKFLGGMLKSPDEEYPPAAIRALEGIGPAATPLMLGVAQDPKRPKYVRHLAVGALGRRGKGPEVEELFLKLLRHKDRDFRGAAVVAAGTLRLVKAIPELKNVARNQALMGREANIRCDAMRAISLAARKKEAGELFLELTAKEETAFIRGHAVRMLGEIEYRKAIPQVLDALEDKDSFVRFWADYALRAFSAKPKGVEFNEDASGAAARRREAGKWRKRFKGKGK